MSAVQRMPAALKAAWIADLRNPKRRQCEGELRDGAGGFCCLGRLIVVADGRITNANKADDADLPALDFAKKHLIDHTGDSEGVNFTLTINGWKTFASAHNDHGATFAQIADAIEREVEGV